MRLVYYKATTNLLYLNKSNLYMKNHSAISRLYNSSYLTIITLVLFYILWIVTETPGHNWAGDYSQYIRHAMNLVDGKAYADTGYIHNTFTFISPSSYPPLFSLTLAFIYVIFGFNFFAFKVLVASYFMVALYVALEMTAEKLSKIYQLVFIVVLALNPYFWLLKNQVLSEYLFMLVVFLTLLVLAKRYTKLDGKYIDSRPFDIKFGLLIGLLLYLNQATREIGIVFVPTILCFEIFHFRKISLTTVAALIVFFILNMAGQELMEPPKTDKARSESVSILAKTYNEVNLNKSHLDYISISLESISTQVKRYIDAVRHLWPDSSSKLAYIASVIAYLLFVAFAGAGYIRAIYYGPGIIEIFIGGYMTILFLFGGFEGLRYMIPIIPILFLYAFMFHMSMLKTKLKPLMLAVAVIFSGATCISYASSDYFSNDWEKGVTNPKAKEFFSFVKASTPEESIFIYAKPRILALFTGRQASAKPKNRYGEEFLIDYMKAINATYLIHSAVEVNGMSGPIEELKLPDNKFKLIYTNKYFYVYKLL